MRAYDIIYKKREGNALSTEEINYLIEGYTGGELPDYQLAAWAMAVFFQGMDSREIVDLTLAMARSGDQLDLSQIRGIKVDKHSTGGVGDKTTLVLGPLVSAAGVRMAKMSGRGLGHTGGTVDKLEAIPGFRTALGKDEFIDTVNEIGLAVIGQTGNLTPADKKLYALRDVTATIDSIPLIASSIMSKKIAGGADGIVFDIKTGSGAFMKDITSARKLAETMTAIGRDLGLETAAVISDMNQPLGLTVGNALEVREAISTLQGEGPADLRELSLTLGAYLLEIAGKAADFQSGYQLLQEKLDSGQALEQFRKMISAQGGDPGVLEDPDRLPAAEYQYPCLSAGAGFVSGLKPREIGLIAMTAGAGRKTKTESIDPAVGVVLKKKSGDRVEEGEPLAVLHVNKQRGTEEMLQSLKECFQISSTPPAKEDLVQAVIK